MGGTSMLCRLSMTSTLQASWRAVISFLEQNIIIDTDCLMYVLLTCGKKKYRNSH